MLKKFKQSIAFVLYIAYFIIVLYYSYKLHNIYWNEIHN